MVGHPPFETKTLRETYQRIRTNEYTIPSRISSNAAKLIQRFLQPNPNDRPDLKYIFYDDFFQCGILPRNLPLTSLTGSPKITEYERRTPTDWKKDSLNGLAKVFDRQMKIEMDEKEMIEERGVHVNGNSLDKLGNGSSGKLKNGTKSRDSDDSDRGIESGEILLKSCLTFKLYRYSENTSGLIKVRAGLILDHRSNSETTFVLIKLGTANSQIEH